MKTITTVAKSGLFRTETATAQPQRVDRKASVIYGCSLMQVGNLPECDERNWTVTPETILQAFAFGSRGNNGLKARFTHPNMSADGMGSYLGRWKTFRIDGETLRADLHIAPAAFTSPQGDLGTYVMDMAESESDMFGVSLSTDLDMADLERFELQQELSGDCSTPWPMKLTNVRAGDVVDEPAATRGGMFDLLTPDNRNLPAQATALLQTYFGDAEPAVVRSRIDGFLDRYFSNKGAIMPDETPTPAAETPATPETPETPEEPKHVDPVAEPDGQPQAQVVHFGTHDLGQYMNTFGDADGARMFRDKVPFQTALAQQVTALRGTIQDLSAENAQLKAKTAELAKSMLGETEALNIGNGTGKKSLSEAFRSTQKKA